MALVIFYVFVLFVIFYLFFSMYLFQTNCEYFELNCRCQYFVTKISGLQSDVLTVQRSLSSKVKIKIFISANYIAEQRSDKCKKHEYVKRRGIKNNKNIQE